MKMRQLRNGVTHQIIDRSGDVPTLQMRDRNVHCRRGDRGAEDFSPIAIEDADVWGQLRKNMSHAFETNPECAGATFRTRIRLAHVDLGGDFEFSLYLAHRETELVTHVLVRNDELERNP